MMMVVMMVMVVVVGYVHVAVLVVAVLAGHFQLQSTVLDAQCSQSFSG